jgi:hypothetical protein
MLTISPPLSPSPPSTVRITITATCADKSPTVVASAQPAAGASAKVQARPISGMLMLARTASR